MENLGKIMTHLWFDQEAKAASEFYLSTFKHSQLISSTLLENTPSGNVDSYTIRLEDHTFMLLSAGPYFKVNPSISFMINCDSEEEVRYYYDKLIQGGSALMPLDKYDFSDLYAWVEDVFGVSWHIMLTKAVEPVKIRPALMFVGSNCGKAEEAIQFYTDLFKESKINAISRYGIGFEPNDPKMINYADFILEGQHFSIMDSAYEHAFQFSEAISLIINCKDQSEIDYYWDALSADPDAEQCGWLKDRFGVSWQITPDIMNEMMASKDQAALNRVTEAFLPMKKFDIETLIKAYKGV